MPEVVIYSTPFCPYCLRAKLLLEKKNIPFKEIGIMGKPDKRKEMESLSGGFTVPQIIIDGTPIGGSDELVELDKSGKLVSLLGIK